ncbi:uncharacterized protein VTP21DRAFT_5806 [Calcarisporiella thermophila]|uniref:uncharacterized protein n=1 Tax=Calcarisporiella thermophila TaxID=911321 RepID=UPI0037429F61
MNHARIAHRFIKIDGIQVFYREAGLTDAATMLLLHGFPSSSYQCRRLMEALGTRYRLIAPDFSGFGNTDAPDPTHFSYCFDKLADITEGF